MFMNVSSRDDRQSSPPRGVAEQVRAAMGTLSPAEKRIGRTVLAAYPSSGLDTVARLAEESQVSAPTVVRFARSLGFGGYKEFQAALRAELADKQESNLSQAEARSRNAVPDDEMPARSGWSRARDTYVAGIGGTFDGVTEDDLEGVISLLASPRRNVVCFGGAYTGYVADLLVAQLAPARAGVRVLPDNSLLFAAELAQRRRGDVAVALDVRRYEPLVLERARAAHDAGMKVVLLTDRWLSPISAFADHVLTAEVRASGPSDTLVPMLALVEGLCELVVDRLGEEALSRLAAVDPLRHR